MSTLSRFLSFTISSSFLLFSASPFVLLPAQPSYAQGEGSALEEIIVTSRRYEESLQDAPVSVNVMTDDYLQEQGIEKVHDIIEASPGSTYIRFNKLQDEYSLRGISSHSDGSTEEVELRQEQQSRKLPLLDCCS